jgi:hypothetical protein
VDSAQIESLTDQTESLPVVLSAGHIFLLNLVWPLISEFESAIKPRHADLDVLITEFAVSIFPLSTQYPIELWASLITPLNLVTNQSDWQIIADVL